MVDSPIEWGLAYGDNPNGPAAALNSAAYGDGRWVAVGVAGEGFGVAGIDGLVVTASSATGPWVSQIIAHPEGRNNVLWNVAYGDGVWVITAGAYSSDDLRIYTATDPTDTWTLNIVDDYNVAYAVDSLRDVIYDGTNWTVISFQGRIYTASDPTDSWSLAHSFRDVDAGIYPVNARFTYGDDTWVVAFKRESDTTIRVYGATSPSGTWTHYETITPDTWVTSFFSLIDSADVGYSPDGFFVSNGNEVWRASTVDGTWTQAVNWADYDITFDNSDFATFSYGEGYYVACASPTTADYQFVTLVSQTIDGTYVPVTSSYDFDEEYPLRAICGTNEWIVVGGGYDYSDGASPACVWTPAAYGQSGWGISLA